MDFSRRLPCDYAIQAGASIQNEAATKKPRQGNRPDRASRSMRTLRSAIAGPRVAWVWRLGTEILALGRGGSNL
jgi:hypothetical protein